MSPFVLAIDAVGAKHGGAASVLGAIARAADEIPGLSCPVFVSPAERRAFVLEQSRNVREVVVPSAESGAIARMAWHRFGLGRALRGVNADGVLCLSGGGTAPGDVFSAAFVQQSLPFIPEAARTLDIRGRIRVLALRAAVARLARQSQLVVVQTHVMADCVRSELQVPTHSILVIPPSASLSEHGEIDRAVLGKLEAVPRPARLLYVGNCSPYKNLSVLISALRLLRRSGRSTVLFATLPPGHRWGAEDGVVALPYMNGPTLQAAYRLAWALVMPSLAETVCLPLLEAGASGLPVIAADRPYAREVAAPHGAFFDPHSPGDLVRAVEELQGDAARWKSLSDAARADASARANARPYHVLLEEIVARSRRLPATHGGIA